MFYVLSLYMLWTALVLGYVASHVTIFCVWYAWLSNKRASLLQGQVASVYSSGHLGFESDLKFRKIELRDFVSVKTILSCGLPVAVSLGINLLLAQLDVPRDSDDDYSLPSSFGGGLLSFIWFLVWIVPTIGVVCWWNRLKESRVINAGVYPLGYWVLFQVFWLLQSVLIEHPLMVIDYDHIAVLGGLPALIALMVLASLAVTTAAFHAYRSGSTVWVWFWIALTLPYIAMMLIMTSLGVSTTGLEYGTHIYTSNATFLFTYLGFGIATVEILGRYASPSYIVQSLSKRSFTSINVRLIIKNGVLAGVVVAGSGIALSWRLFAPMNELHWVLVALLSIGAYVLVARMYGHEDALNWASLLCLATVTIVMFPDEVYWSSRSPYTIIDRQADSLTLFGHAAIAGGVALGVSHLFDIWHAMRALMVSLIWPMLLLFTMSKPGLVVPPAQFNVLYWIDPMMTLTLVFVIMAVVFGPGRDVASAGIYSLLSRRKIGPLSVKM